MKTLNDNNKKNNDLERLKMQEHLILDVTENFCEILENEGVNRSSLAKIMGKTKGYISQILNGGRNLTLRSMADLAYHLGYNITIQFQKKQTSERAENTAETVLIDWNLARRKTVELENQCIADGYSPVSDRYSQIAS